MIIICSVIVLKSSHLSKFSNSKDNRYLKIWIKTNPNFKFSPDRFMGLILLGLVLVLWHY